MNKSSIFAVFISFLVLTPAVKAQSNIYNSDFCDFYAEFPDKIETTRKCITSNDKKSKLRGEITNFIKNFDDGSTIDVKMSCNKITEETYNRFSKEEILFTFESFIRANENIDNFGMSYSDFMASKRAYALASGKEGLSPTINILYLWVGKNSLMSLDAKLIGESTELSDNLFAEITKSIKNKVLDVLTLDENEIIDKEEQDVTPKSVRVAE